MTTNPEKFTIGDTLRSLRDLGALALDTLLEIPERIDTHFANRINGEDEE